MTGRLAARRALVIGAAKTGKAVVAALIEEGIAVRVVEAAKTEALQKAAEELEGLGADVMLGVTGAVPLDGFDLVIPSPAVKPSSDILTAAAAEGTPILSEPELAYRLTDLDIVGITGTNGKTTTTALVGHLLSVAGRSNVVCGNVGEPHPTMVAAARTAPEGAILVTELSSFQLEYTYTFRPRVGVLLNLTPDHLDWHGDFARYTEAKRKIFANQTPQDFAVVNWDDPVVRQAIPSIPSRIVPISHHVQLEGGVYVDSGAIKTDIHGKEETICGLDELRLKGHHNVDNAMAGAAVGLCLDLSVGDISTGLKSFASVEHRLEEVETDDGRLWVNDSKATNADSAVVAMAAYDEPIVLMGGRTAQTEFSAVVEAVAARAKGVVLFGEAGPVLEEAFSHAGHTATRVGTLKEAVDLARRLSSPGDVILLSPACKSFDEFSDYEARGRAFKAWARQEEPHA